MKAYKPLGLTLESFLALPHGRMLETQLRHYSANETWMYEQLERLDAEWLMVGANSGRVYMHGGKQDFPSEEVKREGLEREGEFVFTWGRPPLVESDD